MEKYSCSLPSFFREVERINMAANYAKIRDGGKGAGLHYRAFEGFSRVVALNLRQLRREDFQIATRIREVGLATRIPLSRGQWAQWAMGMLFCPTPKIPRGTLSIGMPNA